MRIKVLSFDAVPDSSGDIFDPEGCSFAPEVPVYFGFNENGDPSKMAGIARLEKTADGLYATFDLVGDEGLGGYLTPYVCGSCLATETTPLDGKTVITECRINTISLGTLPNRDSRILSIGCQLAEQVYGK
jgi:hypothetical protein